MDCNGGEYNITIDGVSGELHQTYERVLVLVIMPLIAVIGVLSNGAFIFAVSRLKHMRNPTNYYLVSLAIADALDVCSNVGDKVWLFLSSPLMGDESGYGGAAGCMVATFVTNSSYFTTLFLITLVSLEKFYAVCHPLRVARSRAGRRARRAIVCACVVAMLFSLTFLTSCTFQDKYCLHWPPGNDFANLPSTMVTYYAMWDWLQVYTTLGRTAPFFVTLVVNAYLYTRIMRALGRRVAAMESHGQVNIGAGVYARNIAARMLIVRGAAYFILLAPFEITGLCFTIGNLRGGVYLLDDYQAAVLVQVTRILSYINSAINPFIYAAINRRYREAYKLAFQCHSNNVN